jgi:hypothetical protein
VEKVGTLQLLAKLTAMSILPNIILQNGLNKELRTLLLLSSLYTVKAGTI